MSFLVPKPMNDGKEYLKSLPPGVRFKPTDEELCFYLFNKRRGKQLPPNPIKEVELYEYDPQTLTAMNDNGLFNGGRREWYFFTSINRKNPNSQRQKRAAGNGFWRLTRSRKLIDKDRKSLVGFKKTLVYYKEKRADPIKTNWIMHEYILNDPSPRKRPDDMTLNELVLCRVYENVDQDSTEINAFADPPEINRELVMIEKPVEPSSSFLVNPGEKRKRGLAETNNDVGEPEY